MLPAGAHSVEVAVLDDAGNGSLYLRDLEVSNARTCSTSALPTYGIEEQRERAAKLQGRRDMIHTPTIHRWMAGWRFNLNGNVHQNWRLTASADTPRRPGEDLFSNFPGQSPDSLFGASIPTIIIRRSADDGESRNGANLGQVLRQSQHGRELRDVGQFQGRVFG